jgi:pimeloyl-ACP methyl ester carboxylesterase
VFAFRHFATHFLPIQTTENVNDRLHLPKAVCLLVLANMLFAGCSEQPEYDLPTYTIAQDRVAATIEAVEQATGVPVLSGEIEGAAWIGQVPDNWNGDLVIYAHGYRGEMTNLWVDPAPQFGFLVEQGYAWAASSYRRNSYDPGIGVEDTKNVTTMMQDRLSERGQLENTYLAGISMGGHITVAAIEEYPSLYQGAMPMCGVVGDVELFDYFLDYNVGAAAMAGIDPTFAWPDSNWSATTAQDIRAVFSTDPDGAWAGGRAQMQGAPSPLTEQGEAFKSFVEVGSGGERVTFDLAWIYWHALADTTGNFLFNTAVGDGTLAGRPGVVAQNSDMSYQEEYGFDIDDLVVRQTAAARNRDPRSSGLPAIIVEGKPDIPVLSVHTIGDLFVPIEMLQIYAREVAENGRSNLLVQRAVRDVGHCTFTAEEYQQTYTDLFNWVETGEQPEGEDLLNDISSPSLGCEFTRGEGGSGLRSLIEACPNDE